MTRHVSVTDLANEGAPDSNRMLLIAGDDKGDKGKAIAIWFGDYEIKHDENHKREKWIFFPAKFVQRVTKNRFKIPYWLCRDKGILDHEVTE